MTKTIRKLLGYLLVISLLLSGVSALAEQGKVTVKIPTEGMKNPADIEFEAYKVAEPVGSGTAWKAVSDFAVSAKGFEEKPAGDAKAWSSSEIKAIMDKIEADLDGKTPAKTARTDATGTAVFDKLDPGIYYIRKNPDSKKRLVKTSASLIALPYFGEGDDIVSKTGDYDVTINAKYKYEEPPKTSFPVTKVWQDDDNFDGIQPTEIKVTLQRSLNGEKDKNFTAPEKTLNAQNQWKDEWTNLESATEDDEHYVYSVNEVAVTGYTTSISGGTITNRHTPKYGAIRVVKQVTVNGQPTTGKQADGTYHFTITGPTDKDYETNGAKKTDANYLDAVPFEIIITDGKASTWSRDKLMPGTYTIKEDTSKLSDAMVIANGGAERTVEVKAGTTADSPAEVTYVNNLVVGSLKITKSVTVNGSATTTTRADGTYRFTVKGPSYPNGYTASIKITNGKSNSVQLDNLQLGEYEVAEVKTSLPSGVKYVSGDAKKTMTVTNTAQDPLTFTFVNDTTTTTTTTPPPVVTPTPPTTEPPEVTPTPSPTPTPTPAVNINGEKIWRDEGNAHRTRPGSIRVQLLRDGEQIQEITVTGGSGNRWSYSFGTLPKIDERGNEYSYTVREVPVAGYTTTVRGTSVINDLVPQTPRNYTSFSGSKTWNDNDDAEGKRPNYITVRLMRNGTEVDRRTVTAANGWQFTFQNVPVDDGYGNNYRYTIREDAVDGYVGRAVDFQLTNSKLPEHEAMMELTTLTRYGTPLAGFGEPELEELMELYDYGTPLWGRPLKTGDELPLYPIVFGGIGAAALIALIVLMIVNKKKGRNAA